jgi:hypothetical protein
MTVEVKVPLTNNDLDFIENLIWEYRLTHTKLNNWERVDEATELLEKFENLKAV